jgi:hypothetical protein
MKQSNTAKDLKAARAKSRRLTEAAFNAALRQRDVTQAASEARRLSGEAFKSLRADPASPALKVADAQAYAAYKAASRAVAAANRAHKEAHRRALEAVIASNELEFAMASETNRVAHTGYSKQRKQLTQVGKSAVQG